MPQVRINKFIASSGSISRRKADDLIARGRVRINGRKAVIGDVLDPASDEVSLDGKPLIRQKPYLLALYKPRHVLTTMSDPQGRPCIQDLVPKQFKGVFPVGRLDFDAEGLLILTNDGDLAHALHHPSYQVPKVYLVKVRPRASMEAIDTMEKGVVLDGKKTLPATISVVYAGPEETTLHMTLVQGLKNQIKRMAASVGLKVVSLKRISIGPVALKGMSPGQIRDLSESEARSIHKILKKH